MSDISGTVVRQFTLHSAMGFLVITGSPDRLLEPERRAVHSETSADIRHSEKQSRVFHGILQILGN